MGFRSLQQDEDFLAQMQRGHDAVVGAGSFKDLIASHVRADEIKAFFGATLAELRLA